MTVPERLDDGLTPEQAAAADELSRLSQEFEREPLDPALHGNDDSPDLPDQSMQWGVRWPSGHVDQAADEAHARRLLDLGASFDQTGTLVCRVCGPWQ